MKNLFITILNYSKNFILLFNTYIGTFGSMFTSCLNILMAFTTSILKKFTIKDSYKNFDQSVWLYVNNLYINFVFSLARKKLLIVLLSAFITMFVQIYLATPVQAAGRVAGPAIDAILGDGMTSKFITVVQSNPGLKANWENVTGGMFELGAQQVAERAGYNIDPSTMLSEDLKCNDQPIIYSKDNCIRFNNMLEQKYGAVKSNISSKNIKSYQQVLNNKSYVKYHDNVYLRFKSYQSFLRLQRVGYFKGTK